VQHRTSKLFLPARRKRGLRQVDLRALDRLQLVQVEEIFLPLPAALGPVVVGFRAQQASFGQRKPEQRGKQGQVCLLLLLLLLLLLRGLHVGLQARVSVEAIFLYGVRSEEC